LDFKDLTKKPVIDYIPEFVETPEPDLTPIAEVNIGDQTEVSIQQLEDIRYKLEYELSKVAELQDTLLSTLSDDAPIPIPDELQDSIGKQTTTVSEYMAGLGSQEYGAIALAEVVEDHYLSNDQRPEFLYASILEDMKYTLQSSLHSLSSELFSDFYKENYSGIVSSNSNHPSYALFNILNEDASASQKIRVEILKAIHTYGYRIKQCVVKQLLVGGPGNFDKRQKVLNLLNALRAMRSMLKFYTAMYAADWKSIASYLRTKLAYRLSSNIAANAFLTYRKAKQALLDPVRDFLYDLNPLEYCPAWDSFIDSILRGTLNLNRKYSDVVADIYRFKKTNNKVQLDRANRAPKALLVSKKWLPLLDAVIISIESVINTGEVDKDMIQKILNVANTKKVNDINHPGLVGVFTEQAKELGIDFAIDPDIEDLNPEPLSNLDDADIARRVFGLKRLSESFGEDLNESSKPVIEDSS